MSAPQKPKRGIKDSRIQDSLEKLYKQSKRLHNPAAIARDFQKRPSKYLPDYDTETMRAPPAESTIRLALAGEPIDLNSAEWIKSYIRSVDPTLMPRGAEWVDLDLPAFYGAGATKTSDRAKQIRGDYQTYSRSLTMPDHIRCGRASILYKTWPDARHGLVHRIEIEEEQFRPDFGLSMGERRHIWRGHVAPRGNALFIVMRSDNPKMTEGHGILGIAHVVSTETEISTIEFYASLYEAERKQYQSYYQIFARKELNEIEYSFIDIKKFDNKYILNKLCQHEDQTLRNLQNLSIRQIRSKGRK